MKKVFFIVTGLLSVFLFTGCDEECISGDGRIGSQEFFLNDFNSISMLGAGRVYIRQGAEQRVRVEGQRNIIDRLNKTVKAGHWDIYVDGCVRDARILTVFITVPELSYVGLSGSGDVIGETNLDTDYFAVSVSGSGEVDLSVDCEFLDASISGSGEIIMSGISDEADIRITGSGNYFGFGSESLIVDADITGSGNIEVKVADKLFATIAGSGNIYYRGDPIIDEHVSGSGKVIKY